MSDPLPGRVVVISGPSGSGKTTLVRQVFERLPLPLVHSISATTRPPRRGEIDGRDYFFLAPEEFARRRAAGEFLECQEVFGRGHWYGTLREQVATSLKEGKWIVLEIDVEGMRAILDTFPDAITIFVRPSTIEELERRLRDRGTESEAAITRRLDVARHELSLADRYRHQVINDNLDQAVNRICEILIAAQSRGPATPGQRPGE